MDIDLSQFKMTEAEIAEIQSRAAFKRGEAERAYILRRLETKWPPSLVKALSDTFNYALKLKTGEVIEFTHAQFYQQTEDWVNISPRHAASWDIPYPYVYGRRPIGVDRGIDIRVSDIVWVMDAPFGS